jgi:hypothetical protein
MVGVSKKRRFLTVADLKVLSKYSFLILSIALLFLAFYKNMKP